MEELITLRLNELRLNGRLQDNNEEGRAFNEAQNLLLSFHGANQRRALQAVRLNAFRAWTDVLRLLFAQCDVETSSKTSLILQSLQLINPKLERFAEENVPEALDLARVTLALLLQLDFGSSTLNPTRGGDLPNERLFQTFKSALGGIYDPKGDIELRELLYNICTTYVAGLNLSSESAVRRRSSTNAFKVAGQKVIDVICDDAYGATGTCRISALLLLDSLIALAKTEGSTYLVESLIRTNFIVVLVETIKDIPRELREASSRGKSIDYDIKRATNQKTFL